MSHQIKFTNTCGCIVDYDLLSKAIHSAFPDFKPNPAWEYTIFVHKIKRLTVTISISHKQYVVARLIAEYLWREAVNGKVIHHRDFNSLNNAAENLQVMSRSEHTKLHRASGRGNYGRQEAVTPRKELCSLYESGWTLRQLAEKYNCVRGTISNRLTKWNITRRQYRRRH